MSSLFLTVSSKNNIVKIWKIDIANQVWQAANLCLCHFAQVSFWACLNQQVSFQSLISKNWCLHLAFLVELLCHWKTFKFPLQMRKKKLWSTRGIPRKCARKTENYLRITACPSKSFLTPAKIFLIQLVSDLTFLCASFLSRFSCPVIVATRYSSFFRLNFQGKAFLKKFFYLGGVSASRFPSSSPRRFARSTFKWFK